MQVGPVKAGGHPLGGLQLQLRLDVLPHPGRCGGRERRHHGPPGQAVNHFSDAQIGGPEVVAPLGHAVRLVHHQQRHVQRVQQLHEPRRFHALRRHVQQLCVAPGHLIQRLANLTRAHGAVDHHGAHTQLHQLIHLILHQRDQRTDHDGHAVQQQRRNLIGQRLASARGQHRHHVPTIQYGRDDLLLSGPERVVAEHALEHVVHPLLHVTAPSRVISASIVSQCAGFFQCPHVFSSGCASIPPQGPKKGRPAHGTAPQNQMNYRLAAARMASTMSSFSHGRSRSSRPKWP